MPMPMPSAPDDLAIAGSAKCPLRASAGSVSASGYGRALCNAFYAVNNYGDQPEYQFVVFIVLAPVELGASA